MRCATLSLALPLICHRKEYLGRTVARTALAQHKSQKLWAGSSWTPTGLRLCCRHLELGSLRLRAGLRRTTQLKNWDCSKTSIAEVCIRMAVWRRSPSFLTTYVIGSLPSVLTAKLTQFIQLSNGACRVSFGSFEAARLWPGRNLGSPRRSSHRSEAGLVEVL